MTRMTVLKREEKKGFNPFWRGIGCLLIVGIFVASFVLSYWFIGYMETKSRDSLPQQIQFLPSALRNLTSQFRSQYPWFGGIGRYVPPLIFSLVVSVIMFGLISLVYVMVAGTRNDPRDVRNWEPPGRKKRRVRRCR
jgi:hypothetical protein